MTTDLLTWAEQVACFNKEVIGLSAPAQPQALNEARLKARLEHLAEELEEAKTSLTVESQADAFIDIIYISLGSLYEMGVCAGPNFTEVHRKNMEKKRGSVSKRPGSEGYDAVKPSGWTPPEFLEVSYEEHKLFKSMPQAFKEAAFLRLKKGEDYNTSTALEDYFPFGNESYAQMLHLKNLRIKSLLARSRAGKAANFEGLRDTLLDMLNYASFYIEWLDNQKQKG